jgi:hypothetical protein
LALVGVAGVAAVSAQPVITDTGNTDDVPISDNNQSQETTGFQVDVSGGGEYTVAVAPPTGGSGERGDYSGAEVVSAAGGPNVSSTDVNAAPASGALGDADGAFNVTVAPGSTSFNITSAVVDNINTTGKDSGSGWSSPVQVVNSSGGSVTGSTSTFAFTEDFEISNLDAPQSGPHGSTVDVSATVTNNGSALNTQTIFYNTTDGDNEGGPVDNVVDSTTVTLAPGESTEFSTTFDTSTLNGASASAAVNYTAGVLTDGNSQTTALTVGTDSNGRFTVDVIAGDTLDGIQGTVVSLYDGDAFNTKSSPGTPVIQNETTNQDGRVQFSGLAVGADENNPETYVAVARDPDFESGTTDTNLFETRSTEGDGTITLDRLVDADDIDIDKTPSNPNVVPLEGSFVDNITVFTQDTPENGLGNNAPLGETPVDITIVDDNVGAVSGVNDGDLQVDGVDLTQAGTVTKQTNTDGSVEVELSLDVNPDDIDENVEFELNFDATSDGGSGVEQSQNITFQAEPPSGDGTISGTVDEIDQSIPVGITAQSNIEPGTNVSVHAVTGERAAENTVGGLGSPFITFGEGGEKVPVAPESITSSTSALNFDPNQNETVRVVAADVNTATDTIVDPTSVSPLDSRSDYLYTSNQLSLTQNTSTVGAGAGFDASENEGFSANDLSITVLDSSEDLQAPRDGYAVQFYNETTDSYETQVAFETQNDLSYQATKERFSDVRAQHTDVTNSQGDFELLNLFTNDESEKTYVVIAGDANSSLGFANARGYSIQPVNQNAAGDAQLEADLSVQEFTPDVVLSYDLDVSVRDENGDLVEIEEVPVDEDREVVVNVTATDQLTGNQFPVPSGQEIDLSLLDDAATQSRIDGNDPTSGSPNFGELLDETVVVNQQHPDGTEYASTTFEADPVNTGVANISASTQNDDGTVFETRDGSGAGTNDRGDQAQIEVFDTVEITGDVVNEDQQNIEGARVLLFDDDVSDPTSVESGDSEVIKEAVTGSDGSYAFVDVRTGEDYEIRAIALDANGNRVSNTRRIQNGDPVFNTPPGQDIVVQGASPNQPFIPADFEVSNLVPPTATVEQGELLNISADVENTGGLEGTQDIELLINGSTVATKQDVELDAGTSTNVEFEDVDTSSLQPGSYVHEVASEDDNVTGSLTVESSDGGNGGAPSNNPLFDESGEPMGELDVISVLTDWSDTGEINGEEVGELELIGYLTDWNEAQSGN